MILFKKKESLSFPKKKFINMVVGALKFQGIFFISAFSIVIFILAGLLLSKLTDVYRQIRKILKKKFSKYLVLKQWLFLILWVIVYTSNGFAVYLYWRFTIGYVRITGIDPVTNKNITVLVLSDMTNDMKTSIYDSGLSFYLATWALNVFWLVCVFFWNKWHYRFWIAFFISLFMWMTAAVTVGLFFGICDSSGFQTHFRHQCFIPGILYSPHVIFSIFLIIFSGILTNIDHDDLKLAREKAKKEDQPKT